MSNTAETVNALIDNLVATGWRLLELPMFMLLPAGVVVAAAVAIILRRRWKQVAIVEAALLLIALVFVADRKLARLQQQLDALRLQNASNTIQALASVSTRPSTRQKLLFDLPQAQSELSASFKGLTLKPLIYDAATDVVQFHAAVPLTQAYIAIVDLSHPGVTLHIGGSLASKSLTSVFAKQNQLTVAINGEAGLSPDPYSGLGSWSGEWIQNGKEVLKETAANPRPYLYFDRTNHPGFIASTIKPRATTPAMYNVMWGRLDALIDGRVQTADESYRQPRTAMAINQHGSLLYLLVVDGRQPRYSTGFTRAEVGGVLKALGAWNGMLCDEGGSSCIFLSQFGGICNNPSDGRERVTYTHFGIAVAPANDQ